MAPVLAVLFGAPTSPEKRSSCGTPGRRRGPSDNRAKCGYVSALVSPALSGWSSTSGAAGRANSDVVTPTSPDRLHLGTPLPDRSQRPLRAFGGLAPIPFS